MPVRGGGFLSLSDLGDVRGVGAGPRWRVPGGCLAVTQAENRLEQTPAGDGLVLFGVKLPVHCLGWNQF